MSNWLNRLENLELTPNDVLRICDNKALFVNMLNTFDLDAVLVPFNCFVLFLPTISANEGHYTSFVLLNGVLYHWDSYGFGIKKLLEISEYSKVHSKNDLIKQIGEYVSENNLKFVDSLVDFQKFGKISTCGRYAGVRLKFAKYTNDKFNRFLSEPNLDTDLMVSLMTMLYSL